MGFHSMLNLTTEVGWGPVLMENNCGFFFVLSSIFSAKK
jgi:hypothetical protein